MQWFWQNLTLQKPNPDLDPSNFWLFSKLLKVKFQIKTKIKKNATQQLMVILKLNFTDCFEKWKRYLDKYVKFQGE